MDFGEALELLKRGKRVKRAGWHGRNMYIELQRPDENSKMTLPYIFINTCCVEGRRSIKGVVPWLASQTDILATDWEEDKDYYEQCAIEGL